MLTWVLDLPQRRLLNARKCHNMADVTSQVTLLGAVELAMQALHGDIDPAVTTPLRQEIIDIWQRVQAKPSTYMLSKEEFIVFGHYRGIIGDNEIAYQAILRFLEQCKVELTGFQEQDENKEFHHETPTESNPMATPSLAQPHQDETQSQSLFKLCVPRLRSNDEAQSLSKGLVPADANRVAHTCEPCRQIKTRCSGIRPTCQNCEDSKLLCTYADRRRRRTKK